MAVATEVVARFTADISDVQSKMAAARGAFGAVGEAATFSSKRIAEVGQTMADVGAKMTVGLTLPLGGLALAASNAAMSFETGMTKIIGLVGIASDEVARMGDEVLAMAAATGKAPDELADGLFVVTSAGLRGSEAMATLANSAKAGAAGLGQTNDIARAVAGALSAYGSEVLSASEATDAIVATARAGNFETSQFAAAIGRVLPFAKQAGASFQDMGGAVALLTRVNGNAAESITQIQALFRAVVVPTEEAKKALDEVGLSAQDLRDSIAEKGLPATLEMLDKALGGNREQLGRLLGSSEAASAAFQILDADARTIQDTFGVVANSAGMTAEAFGAVSGTAQFQVSQAMAELKATLIDLGEQFLPIIKSVTDFMQANLRAFNSLPGPIKTTILMFGALLAALGPILFVVGKLIVVFSSLLAAMLKLKAIQTLRAGFLALRGELAASRAAMKQTQTSIGMLGTAATTAKVAVVGSFKAIGAAAKGLLASLGPIGLAMLAVGAAVEIFIGRAAATEHHLSNLRDEIDLTTGKMTEAAKIVIASELRHNISQEDLAMMENYGISISGFIAALEQGGPALDAYREKITAMQEAQKAGGGIGDTGFLNVSTVNSINTIVGTLDGMIGQYENAKVAAQDAADSQVDAAMAVSDAQRGLAADHRALAQEKRAADAAMTASQKSLDKALDSGVKAVEALSSAFQKMNEVISQEASRDSAIQGIKDLNATLEENGTALKGNSDAAMANRSAIRDAAQGWIDYAAAAKDPEEAQKRLAKGQDQIRAALKKQGIKPEQSDIFKVFKKQQSESQQTVDEFAKQRAKASQYGNDVGMNFIDGILAELQRRKDEVAAAAAAVTSGLTTGGNEGIDATSPSRDAMQVAANFVDGLIVGLARSGHKVNSVAAALARTLTQAFRSLFARQQGPMESVFAAVFASVPSVREAERQLQEASWAVKDARDAVADAEKALAEARKDGSAREVAAAERDLARARLSVKDALVALGVAERDLDMARLIQNNRAATKAVLELARAYENIIARFDEAGEGFQRLMDLTATPLGTASDLSQMFTLGTDPRTLARNYLDIAAAIEQAYAVLLDPAIVGEGAASANRAMLDAQLREFENYVKSIMALQEAYESNLQQLADLETEYGAQVDEINLRYDALDDAAEANIKAIRERYDEMISALQDEQRTALTNLDNEWDQVISGLEDALSDATAAYERENAVLERLIGERDSFLERIADGARAFVNDFSDLSQAEVTRVERETQKLADGVTLVFDRIVTDAPLTGAQVLRNNLQSRLSELRAFTANIRTLVEKGLDASIIREFVAAGPQAAGEAVAALAAASSDEIAAINDVQRELAAEIGGFSDYASEQWFDAAIEQQRAIVDPLLVAQESARAALEQARKDREQQLADTRAHYDALLAAAEASRDAELLAAQEHANDLRNQRQAELDAARADYDAARKEIEGRNAAIETEINRLNGEIGKLIAGLVATLPPQSLAAGQAAMDNMLVGFQERFPAVAAEFEKLMDALAARMEREVSIRIKAVDETGLGAAASSRGVAVAPVPVMSTRRTGNVIVGANAVNVSVTSPAGADSRALAAQVRAAVDEGLESLAREIVAA